MLELIACDDDSTITDFISFFVMKNFKGLYNVATVNSCHELIGMVEIKNHVPDALIMDINLKDGNGIETVQYLQRHYPGIKVIYLTGNIQYATEIFKTNPAYFLVKPIRENELIDAISKVTREIETTKADMVFVRTGGSEIVLDRKKIMYLESCGRKLVLVMEHGERYEIYEKIDNIQERLGGTFVRSHKSYLINMRYIVERTNYGFCLSDGTHLPISKANLKDAKFRFIAYLGEDL